MWWYYRHEPVLNNAGGITDFPPNYKYSVSFKFKQETTGQTDDFGTKDVKIKLSLKYLSNFLRTFEIPSINCEINLILIWTANCVLLSSTTVNQATTFAITDAKLYAPVVILSFKDNAKLLQQFISSIKKTIKWNKYQSKITM